MEWLNTAWAWIESNLMPFLTAANLAAILSVIVSLVRQKRTIIDNTSSSKELRTLIGENKAQTEQYKNLANEMLLLKALIGDLSDQTSQSLIKSNAVLDVQQIVYNASGSLKEESRSAINNLVTNAKYATTKARADIIKEVELMKKQAVEMAQNQEKNADKIKKIVQAQDSSDMPTSLINFKR